MQDAGDATRRFFGRRSTSGLPPAIATGASLGSPVMAHQSSRSLSGNLERGKFILARLEAPVSRDYGGPTAEPAQRAKVGSCRCCKVAPRVAAPPTYEVGGLPDEVERVFGLLKDSGRGQVLGMQRIYSCRRMATFGNRGVGRRRPSSSRRRLFLRNRISSCVGIHRLSRIPLVLWDVQALPLQPPPRLPPPKGRP